MFLGKPKQLMQVIDLLPRYSCNHPEACLDKYRALDCEPVHAATQAQYTVRTFISLL